MREVSLFAVATGMRATEVLSLSWSQVDMGKRHAWITHGRAKNKRARAVPLNSDAMAVLQRRQGTHRPLSSAGARGLDVNPPRSARSILRS